MIDPQSLISTARLLLGESNNGVPNQTRLRRAISTAYYALFHSILRSAEISTAVDKPTLGPKPARAMGATRVSQEIRDVASAFVSLQDRRHWADYAPSGKITRSEARDLVDLSEFAASQLRAADGDERRNFLAYLMHGAR